MPSMKPQPFEIAVPDAELDDLRLRLARTRWADDLGNADWRYGVERGWLEDMVRYWHEQYDWRAAERKINQLGNFKVTIDGVPLHFAHVRGKGKNPMPLLLLHGWPWTFMDFHALVGPLSDPASHGGDPSDSFDLIIPSLPGFGYSMPLTRTGLDVPRSAERVFALRCRRRRLGCGALRADRACLSAERHRAPNHHPAVPRPRFHVDHAAGS